MMLTPLYIPLGILKPSPPCVLIMTLSPRGCVFGAPQRGEVGDKRRGKSTDKAQADHVSLEPMLYNIYTLRIFQTILDNPESRKNPFKHLVNYIL